MKRQLTVARDAQPATKQHKRPCSDCPWARVSLPGWLGRMLASDWLRSAHGEDTADCHTVSNQQCAGMAIYRANMCKVLRDPHALRLPADRTQVFATPMEFTAHHEQKGSR